LSTLVTSSPHARRIRTHWQWVSSVIAPALCALCLILGVAVGSRGLGAASARPGAVFASRSSQPVHVVQQYGLVLQGGVSPNSDIGGGPGTI
jgi:hypothetical protein